MKQYSTHYTCAVKEWMKSVFQAPSHRRDSPFYRTPLDSYCSSLRSFHPSLILSQFSISRFLRWLDYDKFSRDTRARSVSALRVSTSRTDAVQWFFRRMYKGRGDRVSCNTNENFSSILLRYALALKEFRAKSKKKKKEDKRGRGCSRLLARAISSFTMTTIFWETRKGR